jgi:hypothetical protein
MKSKQHIVKMAYPAGSGRLLRDYSSQCFLDHIRPERLLAIVLGITVVLASGCSSTGTALNARLISPLQTTAGVEKGFPNPSIGKIDSQPNEDVVAATRDWYQLRD